MTVWYITLMTGMTRIALSKSKLKVLSAFFTNISAAWFVAPVVTRDPVVLIANFFLAISSLQIAFDIEIAYNKS